MTLTLTQVNESYDAGRYEAYNGVWNAGSLVNGRDYTQSITLSPSTFPNGVTMSWSWPDAGNGSVYAYPEISWSVAGDVVQISDILSLTTDYNFSISGNTSGFNVAFDTWLYADPRGIWETTTSELMLWVHSNGWQPDWDGRFSDGLINANLEIDPDWGDLSGSSPHKWQYIAAINDTDKLSGTVSHSNLLKDLIWKGVLSGYEYLRTVELGAETMQGAGSLHIAKIDYTEARKTIAYGGAGDDTITARSVGQNHVIAGGGTDTVVYAGRYEAFELQSRTQDVLVRAKGDLSTLDILESVEKVQFDDGVYDVAGRTFAPGAGTAGTVTAVQTQMSVATTAAIDGTAAADTLFGTSGPDFIRGLDGNDQIEGGAGDDDINGNMGSDTVYGGEGADWVRGGKDNDFVDGSAGDDPHVNGNLGDDTVRGGIGADTCYGGQGNDLLFGDTGDDLLSGDLGNDTLTGGFGADRFAMAKGGGFDWITDFSAAQGDRIQLAPGTAYSYSAHQGQVAVNLGGGDLIVLMGVPAGTAGDWVIFG
jgi:Ca2+-binding RTX toxin-like protein